MLLSKSPRLRSQWFDSLETCCSNLIFIKLLIRKSMRRNTYFHIGKNTYLVLDRKPLFFRSKIRNPTRSEACAKQEIRDVLKASAANNDRNKNAPMTKTSNFQSISFGHLVIRYSNLFRTRLPSPRRAYSLNATMGGNGGQVSIFEFRI